MKNVFYLLSFLLVFSCSTIKGQGYNTHKVKPGETIESIAKAYAVSKADIYRLNPDSQKTLRSGKVLIIPKEKSPIINTKPKVNNTSNDTTVIKELTGFNKHRVRRKETLYSLSKKYDVEIEDIKKHNPRLYAENLRKGDKIKIPIFRKKTIIEKTSATVPYTVKPAEGKWRIAHKYGITIPELEALNPGLGELKNGQVIQVPNLEAEAVNEIDETYGYYTVQPKEGFYRLKVKLGLEQEELEQLNPILKEDGLKAGMVLKVPYGKGDESKEATAVGVTNLRLKSISRDEKHIAIMLPFKLNRVRIDSTYATKKQIVRDPYLRNSLDFYSGARVALDSLKKMGISIKVDVYDTKNSRAEVDLILRSNNFSGVDAVVGPLLRGNFKRAVSHLKRYNIPVVSPRSKELNLGSNVYQSWPNDETLKQKTFDFVRKQQADSANIVILADTKHRSISNQIKSEFPTALQLFSKTNKDGKDMNYVLPDDLKNSVQSGKNIVFLETDNGGFVSNVTSILNALINKGTEIILITTKMDKAFESDDVSNRDLSNLQFHFASPTRFYDAENSSGFVSAYKVKYNVEPSKMAVRGFDLTLDVILRLATSESLGVSVNEAPLTEYVENKFAYKRELMGGYFNKSVYLVKYDDLKIVEVKDEGLAIDE